MTSPDDDEARATPPELLRAYLATHCVLVRGGRRSLVAGVAPETLPAACLFVITAENPGSEQRTAEENAARNAELEALLRAEGWTLWSAQGEASDGSWSEAGFAVVGTSRGAIVALGERFGQRAVFELDDLEQRVVGCLGAEKGTVLASRPRDWRGRWDADGVGAGGRQPLL